MTLFAVILTSLYTFCESQCEVSVKGKKSKSVSEFRVCNMYVHGLEGRGEVKWAKGNSIKVLMSEKRRRCQQEETLQHRSISFTLCQHTHQHWLSAAEIGFSTTWLEFKRCHLLIELLLHGKQEVLETGSTTDSNRDLLCHWPYTSRSESLSLINSFWHICE